jgi:hypothetical protein
MAALLPSPGFATRFAVPTVDLRPGTWWRLGAAGRPLLDWDGRPGASRFVSDGGGYEVLYLASDKPTAFWEVFSARLLPLAPADRVLPPRILEKRRWVQFAVPEGLKVFDATAIASVRAVGASNMSFHGEWPAAQAFGQALWQHPVGVDGILYRSDKNLNRCVALFHRTNQKLLRLLGAVDGGVLGNDVGFLDALRRKGFLS